MKMYSENRYNYPKNTLLEQLILIVTFLGTIYWFFYWIDQNPLPDGYQNEYLHVGNAYDLFQALKDFDVWHLRWYMYTGYWPWGLYAGSWPFLFLFGMSYSSLLYSNWLYIGILAISCYLIRHRCHAYSFFSLLLLTHAVVGTIVRYEPNLANIAWVSLGCAALLRSQHLTKRNWLLLWGFSLGCGLMMDRLSVLFFLIPAILPLLFPIDKEKIKHTLLGLVVTLFLTAAYYREFFLRNFDELTSQVNVGEIDSAGIVHNYQNPLSPLYYIASIIDTQCGLIIGIISFICIFYTLYKKQLKYDEWALLTCIFVPIVFFSFIEKKQIYYTLPILWPLIYFISLYRTTSLVTTVIASLVGFGTLTNQISFNYAWLPETYVAPRHALLKQPSHQQWNFKKHFEDISIPTQSHMLIFSSDQTLFEGFLLLKLREIYPSPHIIRSLILDPMGSREFLNEFDHFVWVSNDATANWPNKNDIEEELLLDHYDISKLPPIAQQWGKQSSQFELLKTISYEECTLKIFRRKQP